jgi:CRISPR-associated protein Csc2
VIYGYAIGDSGSEKSKIFIDSAYAVPAYEESHGTFTLNAPYEDGTMTKETTTTNRFSEQDHVLPQVPFPSVVTLRDPSPNTFLYVLNNLYRTKRYGAQTTRTGQMRNKVLAVIFADGEIFSNLRLTQKTEEAIETLVQEDGVIYTLVKGDSLISLQNEAQSVLSDEVTFKEWLIDLTQETLTYAEVSKVLKKK